MPPLNLRPKHSQVAMLAFALRAAEPLWLILAGIIAYTLRHHNIIFSADYAIALGIGALSFAGFSLLLGTYRAEKLRKFSTLFPAVVVALCLALTVVVLLLFGFKSSAGFSRLWVVMWWSLGFIGLLLLRVGAARQVRRQIRAGKWCRRVALYGATAKTQEILHLAAHAHRTGVAVCGVYAQLEPNAQPDFQKSGLYKGGLETLLADGLAGQFEDVIISEDISTLDDVDDLLAQLHRLPVNVFYCLPLPLFGRVQGPELFVGVPLVLIYHRPMESHHLWLKRALDISVAGMALLLLAPLLACVALAIKATSPGPVFFKQKRNGFNGAEFDMLKFRSMRPDAPAARDETGKEKQATRNDPRITKVGKFLRRSSIDELPQLINVLRGDMSLVGPRPHALSHNTYYESLIKRYASRHKMRPGLTGWAQVNGWRGETDTLEKMAKRVEYDIWYAEHWSLLLDIKIILLTPLVLFFQKQAY